MKITPLNSIFSNVQNSYKFYWWLSILEINLKQDKLIISFDEIVLKTISKLWYPVNYYKLNFGKLDQCSKYIKQIKSFYGLEDNLDERNLYDFLLTIKNDELINNITSELTRYVPYRFLRPWYAVQTRLLKDQYVNKTILEFQNHTAPYLIDPGKKQISVNYEWSNWIHLNFELIKGFTYLKLLKYLEKNNPLVPNLSIKIKKPVVRKLRKATILWDEFIISHPREKDVFQQKCVKEIKEKSLDHFLPWSVLSHDLIWNLHPVEKEINSSKNNQLPDFKYFHSFSYLQYQFLNFLISSNKDKPLEDYNILMGASKDELKALSLNEFEAELAKHYKPIYEIAENMGFIPNWSYEN
ncbi:HNH endonuclease domain-containing protein [Salegentibacter maritimus]|uniref:HNH endonuclease domain-containing protein n=1 Tax=Salegentibacter maritimus TaxID=2794347 RepID=UPI0018E432D0|nr:HNH endonuclease domain-containing protein [Salegentibacter maritimus]MBI6115993.1 hypothetical protein [Salegentibacter maritimus]